MFRIVAFVCAMNSASCDRESARNVVFLGEVQSDSACLWNAQLRAASVESLRNLSPAERIAFVCEPVRLNG